MKKLLLVLVISVITSVVSAATEMVNGIRWRYEIRDGGAYLHCDYEYDEDSDEYTEYPAVPYTTSGAITIPSTLGGFPVKGIGWNAFSECKRLTSVTIPEGVQRIESWAFWDCTGLKSVIIPASVEFIGEGAFEYCYDLKVTVASGNAKYASQNGALFNKEMTYLLRGPGAMKEYVIPDGVTHIGDWAFSGSERLEWVTIPKSVKWISSDSPAFADCSYLRIKVEKGNAFYTASPEGALFNKEMTLLIRGPGKTAHYKIPDGVETIGAESFSWTELKTVEIPESVITIGDDAFDCCWKLTSVLLPSNLQTIGCFAFDGCEQLKSLTIPASVTSIGSTFVSGDCYKLTALYFEGRPPQDDHGYHWWSYDNYGGSPWKVIGYYSPAYAEEWEAIIDEDGYINDLKMRVLSKAVTVTFDTNGGYDNFGKTGKISQTTTFGSALIVPELTRQYYTFVGWSPSVPNAAPAKNTTYVAQWSPNVEVNGDVAFGNITYTIKNKQATITGCKEEISGWLDLPMMIGDAVVTTIAANAFKGQTALTEVTLPETITTIGADAFKGCVNLDVNAIEMPAVLKTLGKGAFAGCWAEEVELLPGEAWMLEGLMGYKLTTTATGVKLNAKTGVLTATFKKPGNYDVVLSKAGEALKGISFVARFEVEEVVADLNMEIISLRVGDQIDATVYFDAPSGIKSVKTTNLPKGLKIGKLDDGIVPILGMPTKAGCYTTTFTVTTNTGYVESFTTTIDVGEEIIALNNLEILEDVAFQEGQALNNVVLDIEVTSNVKSVKTSKLPAGVKLQQVNGEWQLVGTPKVAGSYPVTLTVTTKAGTTHSVTVTLTVACLPDWACATFEGPIEWNEIFGETITGVASLSISDLATLTGFIYVEGMAHAMIIDAPTKTLEFTNDKIRLQVTVPWYDAYNRLMGKVNTELSLKKDGENVTLEYFSQSNEAFIWGTLGVKE